MASFSVNQALARVVSVCSERTLSQTQQAAVIWLEPFRAHPLLTSQPNIPDQQSSTSLPMSILGVLITTTKYISLPVSGPPLPSVQKPWDCKLRFSGINAGGQHVEKDCSDSVLPPAMDQCLFGPEFGDVVTLDISVVDALTLLESVFIVLDDIAHRNYH